MCVCGSPSFLSAGRNDILLLLDLKAACEVCEFDLQSLR